MARKAPIRVSSRADSAKTANVVLARRLAGGNLNGGGTKDIPLKEPGRWYTRSENTQVDEQRFHKMVHELGYEPLKPEDLACSPEEAGFRVSEDGNLVRGGGALIEMWFKMPKEDRAILDAAFTEANMKGIGDAKTVRRDTVEAASAAHGDEAASFLAGHDGAFRASGDIADEIVGGQK